MAAIPETEFVPGALVRARGRDWIVLPNEEPGVSRLRPVDGLDAEAVGIYRSLEPDAVKPSRYLPPDPEKAGDFTGGLLLRDAVRLGLRSGAGPFRSMGRLSVAPRPYQFVPLIMALRMDPVRLLIADDVGVGKTIEASMIARELLDRGVINRVGVLCAPHLCEQWEEELRTKFNMDAAIIQSSRIGRLERGLPRRDISLYQYYRHLVVSIDFVKSERNRRMFLDNAPDFIIVDEAHTTARPSGDRSGTQHQRYALIRELANDDSRHMVLTTATPHSGIEESFRSLLGLLDESFDVLDEVDIPHAKLAPHFVQRKRVDLKSWLGVDTPFPEREASERSYTLSGEYLRLYEDILEYCRGYVSSDGMAQQRRRVRYWAALSILRCVLSSPRAARAVLENRKPSSSEISVEDFADEMFSQQILDSSEEDQATDYIPTTALDDQDTELDATERRLLDGFLKRAEALEGEERDAKLGEVSRSVSDLLAEGYSPIVYCRFIQTARYVAEHLQRILQRRHPQLQVKAVTGDDGDSEQRKETVLALAGEPVRVLVATDCLSEGVNLQEHYDAVVHYDLPWNPNRLEQREGRVDRFAQTKPTVKTVLIYGSDNEMDLVVLDVLLRKARTIRQRLGISVPVPVNSEQVVNALVDSVLLRGRRQARQLTLALEDASVSRLHQAWDQMADKEERTRAYFAQHGIEPDDVARELAEMEPVLGSPQDVQRFIANVIQRFNGDLRETRSKGVFLFEPGDLRDRIVARAGKPLFPLSIAFDGVAPPGVTLLGRNNPAVATAAEAVLAQALRGQDSRFARSSAIFTNAVELRTAVLVLRLRYLIEGASSQFAEEVVTGAFQREGDAIRWLAPLQEQSLKLLSEGDSQLAANISPAERRDHILWALDMLGEGWYKEIVSERTAALEAAHNRLTKTIKGEPAKVIPHEPPDIIGCYVLVPAGGKS